MVGVGFNADYLPVLSHRLGYSPVDCVVCSGVKIASREDRSRLSERFDLCAVGFYDVHHHPGRIGIFKPCLQGQGRC